ncbi:MAG: nucleotide exchange factor GrpE [Sulfurovum sp.]|nr:MAG: nucleotide exchange factor GrpE [Sulfurovum sp.]
MSKENTDSSIDVELETSDTISFENQEIIEESTEISELDELRQSVAEWEDKFLRTHASFENSKKLLVKDKIAAVAYANENFAKDILSVVDSFENALATIDVINDEESSDVLDKIKEGLELTYNQLTKVLEKNSIKAVECEGQFNPEVHQVIMQVESESHEVGDIVQVLQKGYTIRDRILRPAMVSTAK